MVVSKIYDCLLHDPFTAKPFACGFDKTALSLIIDYRLSLKLSTTCKKNRLNGFYLDILSCVTQGSILGSFLFSLFINDLMFFIDEVEVWNFADYAATYSCFLNYWEGNQKLSDDVHIVLNCFRINSMVANPERFQIMFQQQIIATSHV